MGLMSVTGIFPNVLDSSSLVWFEMFRKRELATDDNMILGHGDNRVTQRLGAASEGRDCMVASHVLDDDLFLWLEAMKDRLIDDNLIFPRRRRL